MLEDRNLASLASIVSPLPEVSANEVFTSDQWTIFLSICEVFVPSIPSESTDGPDYVKARQRVEAVLPKSVEKGLAGAYLAETVAGKPEFKERLRRRFVSYIPQEQVKGLAFLLSALNTRVGSLFMTGSTTIIHLQSLIVRTQIVLSWQNSTIPPLRAIYGACEGLTKAIWLMQSPTLHKVIDYPAVPKDIERHPSYPFKFIDFSTSSEDAPIQLHADIVIIGSGCGSGVVADHLARELSSLEKKPRILLLEKGYHYPSTHFPMEQSSAGELMQESGGAIVADDSSIAVVAGAVFGGGGMINWSASLQPQHFVREDWARQTKSSFFLSQDFQECLDEVCDRMGVCRANDHAGLTKIEHNFGNQTLLEGSRRLGLTAQIVPQNTAGKRHYCGRCHFGCAAATKQGPANLWLPSAADNGVEFIEGCFVDNIVWRDSNSREKVATGVAATWTSRDHSMVRKLEIKADRVISSSGTLHSPLLLHRSGLTSKVNQHIGSNLHLHPVMQTRGIYKDRTDPWDGAILTTAMTSLENLDGKGHGSKIEVNLGTPDLTGLVMPMRAKNSLLALSQPGIVPEQVAFKTALEYKLRMALHGHAFTLITIQRDHADETNARKCYVYGIPDEPRKVKINYTPSAKDRESILQGAIVAARIHYTMGAQIIEMMTPNVEMFERTSEEPSANDQAFEAWISNIQTKGLSLFDTVQSTYGSAHQMGTCRMSTTSDNGAVDMGGKVWGTSNVFVADASIFPSASGVNPMVSTMGLSLHVARSIVKEIKNGQK